MTTYGSVWDDLWKMVSDHKLLLATVTSFSMPSHALFTAPDARCWGTLRGVQHTQNEAMMVSAVFAGLISCGYSI